MLEAGLVILGSILGGVVGWLWASGRSRAAVAAHNEVRRQLDAGVAETAGLRRSLAAEQQARVEAQTRLDSSLQKSEELKQILFSAEKTLKDAFASLSAEAIKSNSEYFAKQTEDKVKPLKEALDKYDTQLKELEKTRVGAYEGIKAQIKTIGDASQQLNQQTSKLVTALRAPQVRGRWGEITL